MSEPFKAALKVALLKLKSRDLFAKEVVDALERAGAAPEVCGEVVAYLRDRRYLDDRRTLSNAVDRASGKRALGKARLRATLLERGVPPDLLDEALPEGPDMTESALQLLTTKFPAGSSRAKAGRFLASRGFDEDTIESALERCCTGEGEAS